jgi:5-methylcytosine-specific restriction protein A
MTSVAGYCPDCKTEDPRSKPGDPFYSSKDWIKLRNLYRHHNPMCERCSTPEHPVPMDDVHHKIPRKKAPHLALNWSNLESLCRACHVTAERDSR